MRKEDWKRQEDNLGTQAKASTFCEFEVRWENYSSLDVFS